MRKRALRVLLMLALTAVLGFGSVAVNAAAPTAPPAPTLEQLLQEGMDVIVACVRCEELVVSDIQLCPPLKSGTEPSIQKFPVIDNIKICSGLVLVDAHVCKLVTWTDVNGVVRNKFARIPVDCCIEAPGVAPTDTVAFQAIEVVCERDELQNGRSILHEKMCVRINLSIQRHIAGPAEVLMDDTEILN
ncbi:MAG: hypothetical protein VB144_01995 [Clostridia bacterium]|nr:hypothetical protein [Clostridia bacterium]